LTDKNSTPGKSYWLWLEPYVHVTVKETALLYNTLSGKKIEVRQPVVVKLLKELVKKENLLVVKLNSNILNNPDGSDGKAIQSFVRELKDHFMGDTAPISVSKVKPVQMMPIPRIDSGVRNMKKNEARVGKSIMSYITELTFYINNYSRKSSDVFSVSPPYYKQFLFPYVEPKEKTPSVDLSLKMICDVMNGLKDTGLSVINITGGNILEYQRLGELKEYLDGFQILKTYQVFYRDSAEAFRMMTVKEDELSKIEFSVTFPLHEESFSEAMQLATVGGNISFSFAVENESELEACEALIGRYELEDFQVNPYYNGRNLDFFEQFVFFDLEGLWEEKPSQKEIFRRCEMNPRAFGKLMVMSNGDIYVAPNAPIAGNLSDKSIRQVVFEEIFNGESWMKTRMEVKPCDGCLYNFLCPPLSNYETVIGRNNLCHVNGTVSNSNGHDA
jgi:pseudo-rSAM protein